MREKSSPLGFYTIGIAALFLLGFLLLIIFGAQVYQAAVTDQDSNDRTRALRSYLVTCTRAAAAEDVTLKGGAEGVDSQILVIRDGGTDYGLQIFLHEGDLVETYGQVGKDPDLTQARTIASTSLFDVEQLTEEAYAVTTDAGRTLLHVGSTEEATSPEEGETDADQAKAGENTLEHRGGTADAGDHEEDDTSGGGEPR